MGEGLVSRDDVIFVLRNSANVSVMRSAVVDDEAPPAPGSERFTIILGNGSRAVVVESHDLPRRVDRGMLHYLSRKYNVPIHLFFHPDQVESGTKASAEPTERAAGNTPQPPVADKTIQ